MERKCSPLPKTSRLNLEVEEQVKGKQLAGGGQQ